MPKYKVTPLRSGKWSEGWKAGEIIDMDIHAAKAAVEQGELLPLNEDKVMQEYLKGDMTDEFIKATINRPETEVIDILEKFNGSSIIPNPRWDEVRKNLPHIRALATKPLHLQEDMVDVVILITDNDRDIALECIEGIFLTTHPFKITVFDNKLNSYPVCNTSKIWNHLVKTSTCKYVLMIDSDGFPKNDIITPMINVLKDHDDCVMVGPVGGLTGVPEYQALELNPEGKEFILKEHLSGYCWMIDKTRLDRIGDFDEDFIFYGQDTDWTQRVLESSYNLYVTPRALVEHGKDINRTASMSSSRLEEIGKFNRRLDTSYAQTLWRAKMIWRAKMRSNKHNALAKNAKNDTLG